MFWAQPVNSKGGDAPPGILPRPAPTVAVAVVSKDPPARAQGKPKAPPTQAASSELPSALALGIGGTACMPAPNALMACSGSARPMLRDASQRADDRARLFVLGRAAMLLSMRSGTRDRRRGGAGRVRRARSRAFACPTNTIARRESGVKDRTPLITGFRLSRAGQSPACSAGMTGMVVAGPLRSTSESARQEPGAARLRTASSMSYCGLTALQAYPPWPRRKH